MVRPDQSDCNSNTLAATMSSPAGSALSSTRSLSELEPALTTRTRTRLSVPCRWALRTSHGDRLLANRFRAAGRSARRCRSAVVLAHDDVGLVGTDDVFDIGHVVAGQGHEELRVLTDRLVGAQAEPHGRLTARIAAFADEAREVLHRAATVNTGLEALVQIPEGTRCGRCARCAGWPSREPTSSSVLAASLAGSALAFYALIGFEDSVNVAEETRDPSRALSASAVRRPGDRRCAVSAGHDRRVDGRADR